MVGVWTLLSSLVGCFLDSAKVISEVTEAVEAIENVSVRVGWIHKVIEDILKGRDHHKFAHTIR